MYKKCVENNVNRPEYLNVYSHCIIVFRAHYSLYFYYIASKLCIQSYNFLASPHLIPNFYGLIKTGIQANEPKTSVFFFCCCNNSLTPRKDMEWSNIISTALKCLSLQYFLHKYKHCILALGFCETFKFGFAFGFM